MFNSQKINTDPAPYKIDSVRADQSALDRVWGGGAGAVHAPRPEFDNSPNPILLELRMVRDEDRQGDEQETLDPLGWLEGYLEWAGYDEPGDELYIDHARKVLEKVVNVYVEQ